jgi:hypothetical protein
LWGEVLKSSGHTSRLGQPHLCVRGGLGISEVSSLPSPNPSAIVGADAGRAVERPLGAGAPQAPGALPAIDPSVRTRGDHGGGGVRIIRGTIQRNRWRRAPPAVVKRSVLRWAPEAYGVTTSMPMAWHGDGRAIAPPCSAILSASQGSVPAPASAPRAPDLAAHESGGSLPVRLIGRTSRPPSDCRLCR